MVTGRIVNTRGCVLVNSVDMSGLPIFAGCICPYWQDLSNIRSTVNNDTVKSVSDYPFTFIFLKAKLYNLPAQVTAILGRHNGHM